MKPLHDLSLQEYEMLKASGMFWVCYPEATGNCNKDLQAVCVGDHTVCSEVFHPLSNTPIGHRIYRSFFYDIIDEEAEYE